MTGNVLLPGARERAWSFGEDYERAPSGLYLPPETAPPPPTSKPVAVDLFAGAGGFSCGFHQAGFHVAAASEFDADAATTYLVNLGSPDTKIVDVGGIDSKTKTADYVTRRRDDFGTGWIATQDDQLPLEVLFLGDVRNLTGAMILAEIDADEVGCICGGPPCQGFSVSGKREVMDPRNSLVFEFMRLVVEVKPKAFVMENVPGMVNMVTPEGVGVIDALSRIAEDGGFGTYESVRRSLLSSSGNGGALKSSRVKRGRDDDEDQVDDADEQLGLFAEVAA